tara:strand:- start:47 stop:283 length:237 start_codon:yes stop_codon:yes gene_type:complete
MLNLLELNTLDNIIEKLEKLKKYNNNKLLLNEKEKYLYKDLNKNSLDDAINLIFRVKNDVIKKSDYNNNLSLQLYGSP